MADGDNVVTFRQREAEPAPCREVWISCGRKRQWRVTDGEITYGEWDDRAHAQLFKALLLAGNDDLDPLVRRHASNSADEARDANAGSES